MTAVLGFPLKESPDVAYNDFQVVPEVASDDVQHVLNAACWCQPGVETDGVNGGRVVIHRRYIDGPLYEVTP